MEVPSRISVFFFFFFFFLTKQEKTTPKLTTTIHSFLSKPTSNFAVEAETKVDVVIFLCFEPEMFLSMFSSNDLLSVSLFSVVSFYCLPQFGTTRR